MGLRHTSFQQGERVKIESSFGKRYVKNTLEPKSRILVGIYVYMR
jgi:hypothetical protein